MEIKLLLIDFNIHEGAKLAELLRERGKDALLVTQSIGIKHLVDDYKPSAVLLLSSPETQGEMLELCIQLRCKSSRLLLFFLSFSEDLAVREIAIRSGANIFILAPFSVNLLDAYVAGHLQLLHSYRTTKLKDESVEFIQVSQLKIAFAQGLIVYPNGDTTHIAPIPTLVLRLLVKHLGKEVSLDTLLDYVWGKRSSVSSVSGIYSAISQIRKRLAPDPLLRLHTSRNFGYLLEVVDNV